MKTKMPTIRLPHVLWAVALIGGSACIFLLLANLIEIDYLFATSAWGLLCALGTVFLCGKFSNGGFFWDGGPYEHFILFLIDVTFISLMVLALYALFTGDPAYVWVEAGSFDHVRILVVLSVAYAVGIFFMGMSAVHDVFAIYGEL